MTLFHILTAVILVSLISLVGVITISFNKKLMNKLLFLLVSFATGTLLGSAFLDLLPEAIAYQIEGIFLFPLLGILSFFVIEKFIAWHHHHHEKEFHAFNYLNLIGDAFHNFIDGLIIAASFLHSIPLGITTTIAVIFHEIPQEIGDFSLLIYGGFSRKKALLFNFISALFAILGALIGFFFLTYFEFALPYLLAFTAGHFIYIASTDIIPELIERGGFKTSLAQFVSIVCGITVIWFIVSVFH